MWNELEAYLSSNNVIIEKGILKVEYIDGYILQIWFEEDLNVSIYNLDFLPIISSPDAGEVFNRLLNKNLFMQAVGRYNITWYDEETGEYNENAIDISPEAVKWFCKKFGKIIKN
ncbi:hypothetical protein MAH1_14160 [Sessilibacter sp. MAH1]